MRSTSIDCSGPRYCLLNAGMDLNELQLIAAGRVIVCLTQDPRVVLRVRPAPLGHATNIQGLFWALRDYRVFYCSGTQHDTGWPE